MLAGFRVDMFNFAYRYDYPVTGIGTTIVVCMKLHHVTYSAFSDLTGLTRDA